MSARGLWWRVVAVALALPLLWGLGLPRYLLLDPLALPTTTVSGALAGWLVVALTGLLTGLRLRRGLGTRPRPHLTPAPDADPHRVRAGAAPPSLAFRAGVDLALTSAVVAIGHWLWAQIDPRLPYTESFSLLSMQVASGWAIALLAFVWARSWLRAAPLVDALEEQPGVRTVFAVSALMLGLFTAVALGIGSSGRAAGALDRSRAAQLEDVADLMAAAVSHAPDPGRIPRLLELLGADPGTRAELLDPNEPPPTLRAAEASAETDYGLIVLDAAGRRHLVRRETPAGVLWISTAANVRPPVRAPDDAPAMLILALLVLGAPLAAAAVGHDLHESLSDVTDNLDAMGPAHAGDVPAGVPVATNDEVGDLAVELNAACQRFSLENVRLAGELDAAAASDRARNRFVAAASHELRTPLNSITGYCHLLRAGELTPGQREDIDVIAAASDQLLQHVDEILDLSAVEAGDDPALTPEPLRLVELARRVVDERVEAVPPAVRVEVVDRGAPEIRADRKRVRQVLENLVGNALKFTVRGVVQVAVEPGELDGAPAVRLRVTDTGPGIPPDELESIFTEFHRVESQRIVAGTGLGLAISRRIVERHGGRVWAESVLDEGSTFHVLLPVEPDA